MKYFKTTPSRTASRHEITSEVFLKVTGRKYPFEQTNRQGKIAQYGICPSCLNPIRLLGVVREIKNNPHGKHAGENIDGLPKWEKRKYEYCPFAAKNERKVPVDDERLSVIDESMVELYNLLKEQFDRAVYVVSSKLGIRGSAAFWESVLKQFLANEAYAYPWLTESNLPYIFAYFGMTHKRLFKQRIRTDSNLYDSLLNYPNVKFEAVENGYAQLVNENGHFLNLELRFINHSHKVVEGKTLKESMLFCVDDITTGNTIYERTVEFDEMYFMNLIRSQGGGNRRQQWLLDISNRTMSSLKNMSLVTTSP